MASKTFKAAVAAESIDFTLEYLDVDGEEHSEKFRCRRSVPVGLILKFASVMSTDDDNDNESGINGLKAVDLVQELYAKAIRKEDYHRFQELIDDPDVEIDVNTYTEIATWLASKYSARPTGETSPSTSQAESRGLGSTDGASARELTYSRLEPVAGSR